MATGLNVEAPGFDLASCNRATRNASWAVFWLCEHLWTELTQRYGDDSETAASDAAAAANGAARVVYGLRGSAASMPLLIAAELNY